MKPSTDPAHPLLDPALLREMANALRFLAADAVERAQSGHPGMPLGMADLATGLFARHLKFDAAEPRWPDRDRFVLSNGHGSMLLYGLLHLTGYEGASTEELQRFRQMDARTAGHPEYGHLPGIETTTGPLGQGIATAVGMALAERLLRARFGADLVKHRTWVFCGDGCLMEGISQEAISLAGHLGLSQLTVIFDHNGTTIDGSTAVATSDDQRRRFEASNWATIEIDGHDPEAIDQALGWAARQDRPTLIAARTQIGFGAPTKQGRSAVHGSPLGAAELAGMRERLAWPHPPFHIPQALREAWAAAGRRGQADRAAWQQRLHSTPPEERAEFERRMQGRMPAGLEAAVQQALADYAAEPVEQTIRQGSQKAVGVLVEQLPELLGGSADLTDSVLSRPANMPELQLPGFEGRHVAYGIREHGMAAALNGIALHGGLLPYAGTYLTFSDYCRPSIRLAALMRARVIFLFSHDSIGVGEDGPTHQPIEHLASLRAMPGLRVYRPADRVEALECWYDACTAEGPSVMVVARQKVAQARRGPGITAMASRQGGYLLSPSRGGRDLTLLATGSEVDLALQVQQLLRHEHGLDAAVVSLPCWERFEEQSADYRQAVLGSAPRFAIEAASSFGWQRYVPEREHFFGIDSFGMSAPGPQVYACVGLTPPRLVQRILAAQALRAAQV